jgi:hypothetical protein
MPFGLVTLAAASLLASSAACAHARGRTISDGALRISLPHGWSDSIGPGMQRQHPVAWILVGNFSFPRDAAKHEGKPSVPRGKLLLSVGDFVPEGRSLNWRRVNRLHLPRAGRDEVSSLTWHVRLADRALWLSVTFGSKPDAQMRALADRVLGSVRPQR